MAGSSVLHAEPSSGHVNSQMSLHVPSGNPLPPRERLWLNCSYFPLRKLRPRVSPITENNERFLARTRQHPNDNDTITTVSRPYTCFLPLFLILPMTLIDDTSLELHSYTIAYYFITFLLHRSSFFSPIKYPWIVFVEFARISCQSSPCCLCRTSYGNSHCNALSYVKYI